MRKGVKRSILWPLVVLFVAICALTVTSFFTGLWLDCTRDGQRWCCTYLRHGCVTFTYMSRDMPPGLGGAGVPAWYPGLQEEYVGRRTIVSQLQDGDLNGVRGVIPDIDTQVDQAVRAVRSMRKNLTAIIGGLANQRGFLGFFVHVSKTPAAPAGQRGFFSFLGFVSKVPPKPDREVVLRFPVWIFVLLAIFAVSWAAWRKHRRIPPGHCLKCSYNLTGNVSGICPECGVPVGERNTAVAMLSQGKQQKRETGAGDQGPAPPTPPLK
ncbi:MAG TPA: hypothetical protein VMV94_20835 [Phycisphaerae bacterium]|nr:hypothetical protein [Phycisphaerae bacterium]